MNMYLLVLLSKVTLDWLYSCICVFLRLLYMSSFSWASSVLNLGFGFSCNSKKCKPNFC